VKVYADEVANTPVRVNLVNPGPTRTGMRAKAFSRRGPRLACRPITWPRCSVKLAVSTCTDNGKLFDEDRRGAVVIKPRAAAPPTIRPSSSDLGLDRLMRPARSAKARGRTEIAGQPQGRIGADLTAVCAAMSLMRSPAP
jgi:NAD(P)-dependent dehydrogenase (short-subunit alcohol dehydrogenase family)